MPTRFVFFDLDDTLLDHRSAERAALADLHRQHQAEHFPDVTADRLQAVYHEHNAPLWRDYGAGRVDRDTLKRLRFERTLAALGAHALDPLAASDRYLDRYGAHWRWTNGARDAFLAVADRVPVGVLTNGFADQQRGKLARFAEIAGRAAAVVISEDVGMMKPNRGIFEHATRVAAEALGTDLAPGDVLYVGDSLHSDVEGGLAAGWRVAWFRGDPDRSPPGDVFVFTDWDDLVGRLDAGLRHA